MGRHREYKNASKDLPTKIVYKYTEQLYTVIVKDISTQEILIDRNGLTHSSAMLSFQAYTTHFGVEEKIITYKGGLFVKNKQYSIKMKKERRKRLI
jgi:hypothetical protein